ncbi:MAG: 7-carboxy-7-deazaguanine synthase QueE [Planctomycetota bacterium]|nr:7-carboxy-7-deazaguanine synthase QueE [Planctomycetota bacterium]
MRVAEIYKSVQGEGFLSGTPSVFVRTSGCNLRCWFCDTPYTSWTPEGSDLSLDAVIAQVAEWDTRYVVLTGGEPMLQAELIPLAQRLQSAQRHITVETAGTLYLPVACDLMSISPKLSNSTPSPQRDAAWSRRHEATRHQPEVMRRLLAEYPYQVKFVVDSRADCDEIHAYLAQFPEIATDRVMLMPQGTDAATLERTGSWLESYCRREGWHFCPRQQIHWFGLVRGT